MSEALPVAGSTGTPGPLFVDRRQKSPPRNRRPFALTIARTVPSANTVRSGIGLSASASPATTSPIATTAATGRSRQRSIQPRLPLAKTITTSWGSRTSCSVDAGCARVQQPPAGHVGVGSGEASGQRIDERLDVAPLQPRQLHRADRRQDIPREVALIRAQDARLVPLPVRLEDLPRPRLRDPLVGRLTYRLANRRLHDALARRAPCIRPPVPRLAHFPERPVNLLAVARAPDPRHIRRLAAFPGTAAVATVAGWASPRVTDADARRFSRHCPPSVVAAG